MLSCYEFDVGISYTDLMRETDVRLNASFAQNALDAPICAEMERLQVVAKPVRRFGTRQHAPYRFAPSLNRRNAL